MTMPMLRPGTPPGSIDNNSAVNRVPFLSGSGAVSAIGGVVWRVVFAALLVGSDLSAEEMKRFSNRRPMTLLSQRWQGVTRQSFDYSCGTGSVANLITLAGGVTPGEHELIKRYAKVRGEETMNAIMRSGFSLLDLKQMMRLCGYETQGVRYEAGTLPDELQPMIVYLVVKGYRHFAVFAGIEAGQILLLDPARGRLRITPQRFLSEWDGTALILMSSEGIKPVPLEGDGLTAAQLSARPALLTR